MSEDKNPQIFLAKIPHSVTEQDLEHEFKSFGHIKELKLKTGYAFIEYENASDSKEAMRKLNKTTLNGANGYSKVRIEFSKKKKVNDKLEDNDNNINPIIKNDIELQENSFDNKPSYTQKRKNSYNFKVISEDKNEQQIAEIKMLDMWFRKNSYNNNKGKRDEEEPPRKNVCFICKLPGHFAKECVLTRDTCYECGEKGHMAKECQAGVREAKTLTKNRVKAVFSQQSAYRFVTPKSKLQNIIKYIQENGVN